MNAKTREALERIIASPNQSEQAKRIAIQKLDAEKETKTEKPATKKAIKDMKMSELLKEAKKQGIKTKFGMKKTTILALLKGEKPAETKPKTTSFDENSETIDLKGGVVLRKENSGIEWTAETKKKGDSFNSARILKQGKEFKVEFKHTTIGFSSFSAAVSHLEQELYTGLVKNFIDEKVTEAKRNKERAGKVISKVQTVKDAEKALKNKIEADGITKAEATQLKTPIKKMVEDVKENLKNEKDAKAFIKELITELTKILKTL